MPPETSDEGINPNQQITLEGDTFQLPAVGQDFEAVGPLRAGATLTVRAPSNSNSPIESYAISDGEAHINWRDGSMPAWMQQSDPASDEDSYQRWQYAASRLLYGGVSGAGRVSKSDQGYSTEYAPGIISPDWDKITFESGRWPLLFPGDGPGADTVALVEADFAETGEVLIFSVSVQ